MVKDFEIPILGLLKDSNPTPGIIAQEKKDDHMKYWPGNRILPAKAPRGPRPGGGWPAAAAAAAMVICAFNWFIMRGLNPN